MTLVVGILTVESSYARNIERPARRVPDTVQFWIASNAIWRIRTYAIDHDIHPHHLGSMTDSREPPTEFARGHLKRIYGDVLATIETLEFRDARNAKEVRQVLDAHKLKGKLELADEPAFGFWNPDGGAYSTKTTPKPK